MATRPELIVLDVYETLLDMSDVERKVNSLMDNRKGYLIWFELFMQYCFVDNCTVQFNDFNSIAKATLQMAGRMLDRTISEAQTESVLELLRQLPVQEEVPEGLSKLHMHGFQLAALTNAPLSMVMDRMEPSGLVSYFEKVLSSEPVKKYKPCIEVYQWAAAQFHLPVEAILLVSSHGWDIAGAANAGMQTAYLDQRKGELYPLGPSPQYTCKTLAALADQLGTAVASNREI
ncbi:MAG TPA: haloacid dehalogenase type II [Flavisolibacter sp.]|jgi:2-haloacid dehalogenase|nr:haloacid dehalogenase type II [Flavisolibacter sp.]